MKHFWTASFLLAENENRKTYFWKSKLKGTTSRKTIRKITWNRLTNHQGNLPITKNKKSNADKNKDPRKKVMILGDWIVIVSNEYGLSKYHNVKVNVFQDTPHIFRIHHVFSGYTTYFQDTSHILYICQTNCTAQTKRSSKQIRQISGNF